MQNPIRLGFLIAAMAVALPGVSQAQDSGQMTQAALTVSRPEGHAHRHSRDTDAVTPAHKAERATAKMEKHARKSSATAHRHAHVSRNAVPRSTFEQRAAHYFDPLSLTLAPESRFDPVKSQYDQVTDSFTPPDKALVAATPDDAASTQISSASIEQMGKGNNHTVVVPLFQILNSLSPGPAPQ